MDVKVIQFVHHIFDTKSFFDENTGLLRKLPLAITGSRANCNRWRVTEAIVASVYQKSSLAIEADLIGFRRKS